MPTPLPSMLARTLACVQELQRLPDYADHGFTMRCAAQAVAPCPGEPGDVVRTIEQAAFRLREHAGWFPAMRTPLRHLVAAMVARTGCDARTFAYEIEQIRDLLRTVGIAGNSDYEAATVMTLHVMAPDGVDADRVHRLRHIHDQLKTYHWWLTGRDDLPTCALLTANSGTPETIAGTVEAIYQGLRTGGRLIGNHLQTAANMLATSRLPVSDAIARFEALADGLDAAGVPVWHDSYDAVAALAAGDDRPTTMLAAHCAAIARGLDNLVPSMGPERLVIAALATLAERSVADLDARRRHLAFTMVLAVTAGPSVIEGATEPVPGLGFPV